jgi:hypothetical protein
MAGGGNWIQKFEQMTVGKADGVIVDINSADDAAYVSLNGDIIGGVGADGARSLNQNVHNSLKPGGNVLVISLYNDNRKGYTGKENSPARLDASVSVGNKSINLSYATPGAHRPGLVLQYVFLLNKTS